MRRRAALAFLLFVVSAPVLARVISYAPYTSKPARAGIHERATRHFILVERAGGNAWDPVEELVLYDSSGAAEPRVVWPPRGETAVINHAALYEPKAGTDGPFLFISGSDMVFSSDGGRTWKQLSAPAVLQNFFGSEDADVGGPFAQGLSTQVLPATDAVPFVYAAFDGVHAVSASGNVTQIFSSWAQLVGRNRDGDKFLIRTNQHLRLLDLNGESVAIADVDPIARYTGWITADDTSYVSMLRPEGRFLFRIDRQQAQFILGPYNMNAPTAFAPVRQFPTMRFFAVPTADFEGAWMIQREPGKPTTLLRHTKSNGTETMWTDVSGPEVEALIPGASGETLLVQVHRPRDGAEFNAFFDPALAVWHIGDPAPRKYDELYMREQWNKGFVHIDVDRLESGEPFVFTSGFFEQVPDIIVSPAPGGGDVIQEWGVVRASLRQRLVLPGVARLHGAFDSYWLTDVTIHNPLDEPQDVEVRFISLGQEGNEANARRTKLTLAANEIRLIADALNALFGMESAGGSLHFIPTESVSVTGRTYSRKSGGGTFGFGMQAIDFFNSTGPRFPMTFAGAFPGENFRTNVLLTDTSGRGTSASLRAFGVNGVIGLQPFTIDAPTSGTTQFNGLAGALGLASHNAGGLHVQLTRGTAIPTVVAIDNRTNDPTYFPPDLPALDERIIPVIGHLDGANNSRFRSDLYLLNPTDEPRTATLDAKQWDSPLHKSVQFTLLPREARVIVDALPTLFGMTGVARLRLQEWGAGEGVRMTSRTYTEEESGATYGSLIPPLNNFQMAANGERLEILGVNTDGGNFRANLGLVELSPFPRLDVTHVRIWIVDDSSKVIDTFTVAVPNTGGMQINDIFAARGVTPPRAALIALEVIDGSGTIGAYATLTDNVTNDTTYLGANLGAQPN